MQRDKAGLAQLTAPVTSGRTKKTWEQIQVMGCMSLLLANQSHSHSILDFLASSVADSNPDPDPPDPHVLGLLDTDPDPLVRGMHPDPAPDPSTTNQK